MTDEQRKIPIGDDTAQLYGVLFQAHRGIKQLFVVSGFSSCSVKFGHPQVLGPESFQRKKVVREITGKANEKYLGCLGVYRGLYCPVIYIYYIW